MAQPNADACSVGGTSRMRYISSKDNLKAIMMLLRDKSGQIQFEVKAIESRMRRPGDPCC